MENYLIDWTIVYERDLSKPDENMTGELEQSKESEKKTWGLAGKSAISSPEIPGPRGTGY